MGVDANYVYGYMVKLEDVEWDVDYLKGKFNLNENLEGLLSEYTYNDLIEWLENDEIDDWHYVENVLGIRRVYVYDQEYLFFTHFDIMKKYPDGKLGGLDQLANMYAKECGVKNYDAFEWDEYGYFD